MKVLYVNFAVLKFFLSFSFSFFFFLVTRYINLFSLAYSQFDTLTSRILWQPMYLISSKLLNNCLQALVGNKFLNFL